MIELEYAIVTSTMTTSPRIFCTIFDKNYLFQGIALFRSLKKTVPNFKLYCLALDPICEAMLRKLAYPKLVVVSLSDFNPETLTTIKSRASHGQFCWTTQPMLCQYVLKKGEASVTYLESDSWFFSSPDPLFQEIGELSISLSPHAYTPMFRIHEAESGKFCTQFNYFKNDANGIACVESWLENCLKYRADKPYAFPGQLCLNDWEDQFKGVLVLSHKGEGVAPWNVQKYVIDRKQEQVRIDESPLIFYHFHQLMKTGDDSFDLGDYPLPNEAIEWIYKPYMKELLEVEKTLLKVDPEFKYSRIKPTAPKLLNSILTFKPSEVKKSLRAIKKRLKGVHNVISFKDLI